MSDMKCPFCQQELSETIWEYGERETTCFNCDITGNSKLWQELIRTRKALDVAVNVIKEIDELLSSNRFDVREVPLLNITQAKISMLLKCINIEQITALEQKE